MTDRPRTVLPAPPRRARAWRTTLALTALALVLRLGWLAYARPAPVSDYAKYRSVAAEILDHRQVGWPRPSAERLPGFPLYLAAFMTVSRADAWLSLATVLLSSLLVLLVHRLMLRLGRGDRRLAFCAALVCAIDLTFVFWAPILASEHLFSALLFAGLLALTPGAGRGHWLLAGAALGAGALTRGEGVFYVPLFLVLAAWSAGPGRRLRAAVLVLLPFLLLTGAWAVRNRALVGPGAGLSTTGGTNFYMAHNPYTYGYVPLEGTPLEGLPETEQQRLGYRLGLEELRRRPLALVGQILQGTRDLYLTGGYAAGWSALVPRASATVPYPAKRLPGARPLHYLEYLVYAAIAALALISVLAWRAVPAAAWAVPLSVAALNWLCYAVVFWGNGRYRYPAEAAFCLLAGLALARLLPRRRRA